MASIGPGEALLILSVVGILALYAGCMVVLGMKGRWLWLAFGVVFGPLAIFAALLPAKPGSAWERRKAER